MKSASLMKSSNSLLNNLSAKLCIGFMKMINLTTRICSKRFKIKKLIWIWLCMIWEILSRAYMKDFKLLKQAWMKNLMKQSIMFLKNMRVYSKLLKYQENLANISLIFPKMNKTEVRTRREKRNKVKWLHHFSKIFLNQLLIMQFKSHLPKMTKAHLKSTKIILATLTSRVTTNLKSVMMEILQYFNLQNTRAPKSWI